MSERLETSGERLRVRVRWAWPLVLLGSAFAVLTQPSGGPGHDELAERCRANHDVSGMRDMPVEDEDA
jgi:hypothetical protein